MEWSEPSILFKTITMTSNEILKADVLDIVFENRNKKYGAYLLRKYYNNRLKIGLAGMCGFVLIVVLLITFNPAARNVIANSIGWRDTVTVSILPTPPPEPPPATIPPQTRSRQVISSNRIVIADETTIHTQDEIENALPSNIEADGPPTNGTAQLPFIENAAVQETIVPHHDPPPAPSSAASFPGGQQAWMTFLSRNLRTPDELEAGLKKTVLVRFSVGADGVISQFEVVQSGGEAFDNEVIRVLKKMPKWKPAVQNGQNFTAMFTQPVTFMAYEE